MDKRTGLTLAGVAALIAICAEVLAYSGEEEYTRSTLQLLGIIKLVGVGVVIAYGRLIKSPAIWGGFGGAAILLGIGVLLKIMHWPGGNGTIIFAYAGAIITYLIHFALKTPKLLLDVLKLLWVIILVPYQAFTILHLPYAYYMGIAQGIVFLLMMFKFLHETIMARKTEAVSGE